jgi:hypothetical protein
MSKLAKILVTIGVVFLFLVINTVITGVRSEAGYKTPGFLAVIVFVGMIGALKAIWKKPKNEDDNKDNDNTSILQK